MQEFEIAGASVPGMDHVLPGKPGKKNNQDAWSFDTVGDSLVAVVCDGCGSAPHSEVGAQLCAQFLAARLAGYAYIAHDLGEEGSFGPWDPTEILERTAKELVDFIRSFERIRFESTIVEDHFLCTAVVVIVNPRDTVIATIGDGVYAINDEVSVIPEYPGNSPPYLAYRVTGSSLFDSVEFTIRAHVDTKDVQSVLIGTDGVKDLIACEKTSLPGKEDLVGPISQFWKDDKFFRNSDAVRRRLALINLETANKNMIHRGLLPDDTTLVAIRRKS